MFDYIIVTHIPNFYKVNLYNQLSKKMKILVVFIASNTNEKRSDDFINLNKLDFEYKLLHEGDFENRDVIVNILKLRTILKKNKYRRILVSGWNTKEYWYCVFTNKESKNCLALESTIHESNTHGIKGIMKKIFLSRISLAFASGSLHNSLLSQLNYKGKVKITKGVGIINKPQYNFKKKEYKKRFIFIGRLSKIKNINMLVDLFNHLEEYMLTIIGSGPLEKELKNKAKDNIVFKGQIANKELEGYFEENNVLILPSISETWGLVVEEAIYFGIPVIVSSQCGVSEIVKEGTSGYVVNLRNPSELKDIILGINDTSYQKLIDGVDKFCMNKKDLEQIASYDIL